MMQLNNTVNSNKGQHVSLTERIEIQTMKRQGASDRHIARQLGRSHATINNEVKRGTASQVKRVNKKQVFTQSYFAETGQAVYKHRRKVSRKPYKLYKVSDFIEFVTKKIKEDRWSPDAVVGYVRLQALFDKNKSVCTNTLYRYIDEGLLDITNMDLLLKLRRNTRKRRVRANKRVLGTSINMRPKTIDDRQEFGHWEIDTVLGTKGKEEPVLLTLIERQTRYEIIFKIDGKTDHAVRDAMSRIVISDVYLFEV